MKKRIVCLLLMLTVFLSLSVCAFAASDDIIIKKDEWKVVFNVSGKLVNRPEGASLTSSLNDLQPGDTMVITIPLINEYPKTTDWYMWNWVRDSLEDAVAAAKSGGYSYKLKYTGPGSAAAGDVLFDSDTVGGLVTAGGREGLHEATSGLEDYFLLGTFKPGQQGEIELTVSLDGETQGNNYQDTFGRLQMRFAVELPEENKRVTIVKTGDEYKLVPLYIAMVISGLVFLYFALDALTDRIYGVHGKR